MPTPSRKFSKGSALVHLLKKLTVQRPFETRCRGICCRVGTLSMEKKNSLYRGRLRVDATEDFLRVDVPGELLPRGTLWVHFFK